MARKPDELLKLVQPWGIEKETRKYMEKYLSKGGKTIDVDSWIRDRRTAEQFAEQMKAYWAVEDAFASWLEKNLKKKHPGVSVTLTGTDRNREIIQGQSPKGKVTGELDYNVSFLDGPNSIPVEFQFSAVTLNSYDVKKNKVNKAEKQNGIILFAFLPIEKFTIMTADYIKKHGQILINSRLGGKETWNIPSDQLILKDKDYQIGKEDLLRGFV